VNPSLAAVLGLGFGAGLWLVISGLSRRVRPPGGQLLARLRRAGDRRAPVWLVAALGAVAVVGLATGWPVAGLLAGAGVWAVPGLLAGARTSSRAQARLEAVAGWAESLKGTLAAGAGLEQVIVATAPSAPAPIRAEVTGLAQAINEGVRLPEALRAFAADLDHPDGDRVVAALLLAATGRARHLGDQLGALAAAAREQAAARLRVDTEWATTRTSVRVIIVITVLMAAAMVAFNREFLEPYDTGGGQVMLALVGGLFAAGFVWLGRLSRIRRQPRVLAGAADVDSDTGVGVAR
jgi:Flp pilus assembly protein TadB